MNLEDIVEKIKRLENGGSGSNVVCFIVAFDFLYFIKENDNRERFIYEYYKNDNGMFTANFKKICYYAESILLSDDIYDNMLKSIEMEVHRDDLVSLYNYFDAIDRIEKANKSPKNMISDGFKIRLLKDSFSSSNDDYLKLNNEVSKLKLRYEKNIIDIVAIISIFVAISIGMVSGISFSLQAFSNLTNNNLFHVCLVAMIVGIVIFNLFFSLFWFISKIMNKQIDKKNYVIYVNVIFVALIVLFVLLSK